MTYVQYFSLCLREEGPRSVTAPCFGRPTFRNCHFIVGGLGGWGVGGGTAPSYPSLVLSLSPFGPDCMFDFFFGLVKGAV